MFRMVRTGFRRGNQEDNEIREVRMSLSDAQEMVARIQCGPSETQRDPATDGGAYSGRMSVGRGRTGLGRERARAIWC